MCSSLGSLLENSPFKLNPNWRLLIYFLRPNPELTLIAKIRSEAIANQQPLMDSQELIIDGNEIEPNHIINHDTGFILTELFRSNNPYTKVTFRNCRLDASSIEPLIDAFKYRTIRNIEFDYKGMDDSMLDLLVGMLKKIAIFSLEIPNNKITANGWIKFFKEGGETVRNELYINIGYCCLLWSSDQEIKELCEAIKNASILPRTVNFNRKGYEDDPNYNIYDFDGNLVSPSLLEREREEEITEAFEAYLKKETDEMKEICQLFTEVVEERDGKLEIKKDVQRYGHELAKYILLIFELGTKPSLRSYLKGNKPLCEIYKKCQEDFQRFIDDMEENYRLRIGDIWENVDKAKSISLDTKVKILKTFVKDGQGYPSDVLKITSLLRQDLTEVAKTILDGNVASFEIDPIQHIPDPFVCRFLIKNGMKPQLLHNPGLSPTRKQTIIEYFSTNSHLEGAQEIVDALR